MTWLSHWPTQKEMLVDIDMIAFGEEELNEKCGPDGVFYRTIKCDGCFHFFYLLKCSIIRIQGFLRATPADFVYLGASVDS